MEPAAFFKQYAAALYLLFLVFTIMGLSMVRERMLRKQGAPLAPVPAADILRRAIGDTPALLAVALTGTVVVLAVTQTDIPKLVSDAFFIAVGYYFGERTQQRGAGLETGAAGQNKAHV